MHAHLKSTQGENVSLGYCPLDLFARDRSRVTRALHALWDVWIGSGAAVNNLRVFVAGRKLTPTADVRLLFPLLLLLLFVFGALEREVNVVSYRIRRATCAYVAASPSAPIANVHRPARGAALP